VNQGRPEEQDIDRTAGEISVVAPQLITVMAREDDKLDHSEKYHQPKQEGDARQEMASSRT
jgi:hypothetical protein